jgi:hypothetical protein
LRIYIWVGGWGNNVSTFQLEVCMQGIVSVGKQEEQLVQCQRFAKLSD